MVTRVATSSGGNPSRAPISRGDHHSDVGVVAGEALADVVEQSAEEQQVGPLHPVGESGRVGGGLEQVAVHGVTVVRVALGLVAHGSPLRQVALDQVAPVEGLEGGDRPGDPRRALGPGSRAGRPATVREVRAPCDRAG